VYYTQLCVLFASLGVSPTSLRCQQIELSDAADKRDNPPSHFKPPLGQPGAKMYVCIKLGGGWVQEQNTTIVNF